MTPYAPWHCQARESVSFGKSSSRIRTHKVQGIRAVANHSPLKARGDVPQFRVKRSTHAQAWSALNPAEATKRRTIGVFRKAHGGRPRKGQGDDHYSQCPWESQEAARDCMIRKHTAKRKGFVDEFGERVILVSCPRVRTLANARIMQERSFLPS